jgi:NAD(P)-dependent dehydrogenase (short-subunit alcohol dehydrogenase family)
MTLQGKVAFVTGASSGLGAHFAKLLASNGARVALVARRTDRMESVAKEIRDAGGSCAEIALDVTEWARIAPALDEVERALGPIDILINNAGMSVQGIATELAPEDFARVMNTNVNAPFALATEVARRMIARKARGRIINIASIGSLRVLPGLAAYCASKAAVAMLTQCLAREWARYGINVNALCPGYIETELNDFWFRSEKGEAQVKTFPRKHLMKESDLDAMFLLLASDASQAITGSLLTVDEGQSL